MMDRRRFLALSAATAALPHVKAFAQAVTATLILHPDQPGAHVPSNFLGLSYETQQLSEPAYFSAANTALIAQFRKLAPHGVLRLGGNTSDYGFWKPTPTSVPPPRTKREYKVGDPPPDLYYGVTPLAVRNLKAFLDATGWTCLYGINLGTNTTALAADEAAFVAQTLGDRLEYFQVGNEADRFATTIRDPKLTGHPWNADAFLAEWLTFANAIVAKVPNAKFGLPDVASNAEWLSAVGNRLADNPIRSHVACISHHYYFDGPPSNPEMNIPRLLQADPRVLRDAAIVRASAAKLDTAYRMTEGNTCYRGGKPGVSDVFAAALWSADYLLLLASLGYAGVNLHGGESQWVANSLGGKLPGDEIVLAEHGNLADQPRPYYTPIAHMGDNYVLEPVAIGMKFAGHFAGATVIPVDFNPGGVNATAYAAESAINPSHRGGGYGLLAIINKDAANDLTVALPKDGSPYFTVNRLTASSLEARDAKLTESSTKEDSIVKVPRSSAVLLKRFYK
jgi:hypothetical protein